MLRVLTRGVRVAALIAGLAAMPAAAPAADLVAAILRVESPRPEPLSRLDAPPRDEGFAGAQVGMADNATTGGFLGHSYRLIEAATPPEAAMVELDALLAEGVRFVVAIAEADMLLAMADRAAAQGAVVLNVAAPDDRLRGADCRANLLHVTPSRRMIADGLAQFLAVRQWTDWVLVSGANPADRAMADAYAAAAERFGARVRRTMVFDDPPGSRRADSGHVQLQRQIPTFMQDAPDHDVVVVADQSDVFGLYLPYRTWRPRPVVGDAGLRARAWHPAHEGFGATQLQRRFEAHAGRRMTDLDYEAWVAVRALGEAVTRTGAADVDSVMAYLLSDSFELAAFKGLPLSFRPWTRQLRQAVMLADDRNLVSLSPQSEFLHQHNRLDTLGVDRAESACRL